MSEGSEAVTADAAAGRRDEDVGTVRDDRYPGGYPDGVDVARAVVLAERLKRQWPQIPDDKGRVPGAHHFVAMALLAVIARLAAAEADRDRLAKTLAGTAVYIAVVQSSRHGIVNGDGCPRCKSDRRELDRIGEALAAVLGETQP